MILKHGWVAIDKRRVPVEPGFARELFVHSYYKVVANVLKLQFKKKNPRAARSGMHAMVPAVSLEVGL